MENDDFLEMGCDVEMGVDTLPHLEKIGNSNLIIEKILDPKEDKDEIFKLWVLDYSYFAFKIRDKGWFVCCEGVIAEGTIRRMRQKINEIGKPLRTFLKLGQGNKLMFMPWREDVEKSKCPATSKEAE